MAKSNSPQPFGWDEFCREITGKDKTELVRMAGDQVVGTLDCLLSDKPRIASEALVDRMELFQNFQFELPGLTVSFEEAYAAFSKLRTWETAIHPRNQFPHHTQYWDPTYDSIERAYLTGNQEGFKAGIKRLLDKIIHD